MIILQGTFYYDAMKDLYSQLSYPFDEYYGVQLRQMNCRAI